MEAKNGEEVNRTGGPHQALLLPETLDRIVLFLDKKSLKTARLICGIWNDTVLANFHRRLKLVVLGHGINNLSILPSVDERMLSSLAIRGRYHIEVDDSDMKLAFDQFRKSENLGCLKVLDLSVSEWGLDHLIFVINEGGLCSLEELTLWVYCTFRRKQYKCGNLVAANTLSCLRHFEVHLRLELNGELVFNIGMRSVRIKHVRLAIQSFVAAAHNLRSVESNVSLNLTEREVRKLTLNKGLLCETEELARMMGDVSKSLVSLCLNQRSCTPLIPHSPNLSNLEVMCSGRIDLTAVPALRNMKALFSSIPWEEFPKVAPPLGKLMRVELLEVPVPEKANLSALIQSFRTLLNSRVDKLVLKFERNINVAQLSGIVQLVDIEEVKVDKRVSKSVFEVHCNDSLGKEKELFRAFSNLLEKLGERWDTMRLIFSSSLIGVSGKEVEIPLFGGLQRGKIKISDEGKTAILQMVE